MLFPEASPSVGGGEESVGAGLATVVFTLVEGGFNWNHSGHIGSSLNGEAVSRFGIAWSYVGLSFSKVCLGLGGSFRLGFSSHLRCLQFQEVPWSRLHPLEV